MIDRLAIPALRKLRSEDQEVQASLGNTAKPMGSGGGWEKNGKMGKRSLWAGCDGVCSDPCLSALAADEQVSCVLWIT